MIVPSYMYICNKLKFVKSLSYLIEKYINAFSLVQNLLLHRKRRIKVAHSYINSD